MSTEAWLRGPVPGVAPVLQPAAHALIQAKEDVMALAPQVPTGVLWAQHGAATAGFHLLHTVGALDRLFSYARGDVLSDAQKEVLRAEAVPHPELDGTTLATRVSDAVDTALAQLRATDPDRVFDERKVGRSGLPATVLGLLFHGAEHTTRHVGQFITSVKWLSVEGAERR
jgi:hypothetical protein